MEYNILMDLVSRLGTQMAMAGAETYRVEENVVRILAAYSLEATAYSVPNSLIISIQVPDAAPITRLCRIHKHDTDLDAVERYSNLSRRICAERPAPEQAQQWLREAEQSRRRYGSAVSLLGHLLVAVGFCLFMGGSAADSLCSGLCGLLVGLFNRFLDRIHTNTFFQKIASAFIMAFAAYAMTRLGLCRNVNAVIIGALMLLVPGLLFTHAMRDIIFGDTNSGVNRIVEVLLVAAATALGTAAAWNLSTVLWGTPAAAAELTVPPLLGCVTSVIACAGFVIVFNIHGWGSMLCALGGGITWAAWCIAQRLGAGELLCCFAATLLAALYSELMARLRKYPAISYLVISLLPLIPGASIYYSAQQAVQQNMQGCLYHGVRALAITGVMAVGILLVSTAVRIITRSRRRQPCH